MREELASLIELIQEQFKAEEGPKPLLPPGSQTEGKMLQVKEKLEGIKKRFARGAALLLDELKRRHPP